MSSCGRRAACRDGRALLAGGLALEVLDDGPLDRLLRPVESLLGQRLAAGPADVAADFSFEVDQRLAVHGMLVEDAEVLPGPHRRARPPAQQSPLEGRVVGPVQVDADGAG